MTIRQCIYIVNGTKTAQYKKNKGQTLLSNPLNFNKSG